MTENINTNINEINDTVDIKEIIGSQEQTLNLISIDQAIEDFSKIEIVKYLSFGIKKIIINKILETCVSENQFGLKTVDYALLRLVKYFTLINNYTNIDFALEDTIPAFDKLVENGVIDFVFNHISKNELNFFNYVLDKEIKQIQSVDNSVSCILAKTLNILIEKIPDQKSLAKLIKDLPKQINKLDPEKLKFVSEAIGWNNGVKKEG